MNWTELFSLTSSEGLKTTLAQGILFESYKTAGRPDHATEAPDSVVAEVKAALGEDSAS